MKRRREENSQDSGSKPASNLVKRNSMKGLKPHREYLSYNQYDQSLFTCLSVFFFFNLRVT